MQKFPDAVILAMHHTGSTVTCLPVALDDSADDLNLSNARTYPQDEALQNSKELQKPFEGNDAATAVAQDTDWESALFFVLPLSVTHDELKSLFPSPHLFPVALEADLIEHEKATLIELGIEIDLGLSDSPAGRVLFLTGHLSAHHEAVSLLGQQQSISLFVGDVHCNLLHQQRIPLADEHRSVFREMLQDALKRDSLIKMTSRYDPDEAFESVTKNS